MKKIILSCWILIVGLPLCIGQNIGDKLEFGLGFTPGLNWLKPDTKMIQKGGVSLVFGFGAKINYQLSKKYALGVEINLQNAKANTHFEKIDVEYNGVTKTSSSFDLDYRLKYLEIPVLLKMRTEAKNNLGYYGEFGGNFGFLLNQLAEVSSDELNLQDVNTDSPEEGDKFTLKNSFNNASIYDTKISAIRAGLIFGAGVQYIIGNGSRAEIGLRYNLALSDIFKESKWKASNPGLGLNVAFIF